MNNARAETNADAPAGIPAANGGVPYGMIGDVKVSRMLLGSNFMGGEAHSRDLVYVRQLMKNYNTDERVNNSMKVAESFGINTVVVWRPR